MKIFVGITLALAACGFDPSFDPGAPDGGTDAHVAGPSCSGLAATCGSDGTDDCCSIAEPIPGGAFYRSFDYGSDGLFSVQSSPATVSPFVLDKYEVTVGRFRKFIEAGMGTQESPPPSDAGARTLNGSDDQGGWDGTWNVNLEINTDALKAAVSCQAPQVTWTSAPAGNEAMPMNCITWYEAFAFCVWDEGFVPTEAQYNYAAAGGSDQRAYAWSSPPGALAIDCSYANYNITYPNGPFCVNSSTGATNRVGSESPRGNGKWGHSDLGGDVDEWVLDGFAQQYVLPCDDCANLNGSGGRVLRSGDWANGAGTVRSGRRDFTTPTGNRDPKIGLRCARAVTP